MSSNIWITTTSAQALEGSTATTAFTFTVWRDGDTSGPASVDWTVSGNGPSPANAADFINGVFPTGHVVIPAGQASATFTVLVVGDTGFESDEGFEVALSNPVGGLIGVPTAPGTATSFTEVVDNSAATALAMANTMLGTAAGLTIVSAQFTGEPAAASMYNAVNLGSAGGRSLALGAGILLTSGDGTPPASNTTDDYSAENFRLGDTALDAYAAMAFTGAGGTADATSLQVGFTVMPVGGTAPTHVSLDIMFGSEEFPEFSDTSFVDIAAIEIDGINYAYFNESNQQPLSVIDTNLLVGNFIDNQGNVLAIEYDGISAPLRVVGALNPLIAQHTIRIAIADTGDYSWDSGIFVSNLRAFTGSPTSGGGISVISQDSAEATILNDDAQIVGTVGFSGTSIYRPLDLMFLHDLSGSFSDDVTTVQALVPDLVSAVRAFQADSRFGVASFVDKPLSPFGDSGDYVYRTDLALSADQATLQSTINALQVLGGNDTPEAQIEALMQLALRTTETGYRTDAMRVAVLMTDAPYHVAGDHSSAPANDGDTELEGSPAGTGEDYPALAQLKAALESANIVPVFAVTSDVLASYQSLVSTLGRGVVVPLSSNSSDLVNSLTLGLKSIAANVDQDEGNSGDTPFVFTVTRDGDTSVPTSVDWAVAPHGGNPVDADDLVAATLPSGTVNFAAGESSKTITVHVNGDTSIEADEGFRVTLVNPSGLTVRADSAFADGTVRNDDAQTGGIWITAANALLHEGHSGATAFTFTVSRDGSTGAIASVDWAVSGTGTSAANAADFFGGSFPSGTVSFGPGETSKTITVNVNGDTTFEPDEGFKVTLSNATGAVIGTPGTSGTGVVTAFVPIAGTDAATAQAMANKLLGGASGVTIVSAQYSGSVNAASLFDGVNLGSASGSTLALGAGVLLTSGDGTPALSNTQSGYTQTNSVPGDSALDGYAHTAFSGAGTTLDATVLAMTFTVAAGAAAPTHVSIDLMFGSDEYPEYSDSSYVDIAAIEIDGVNYAYFNQSPQQPLSVISNNLSVGNFIDNQGNILAIEYDGISAPLRVVGALNTSLSQHTVRIAIADTGDSRLDSGIFVSNLRAFSGSPTSGGGISVISQDSAEATILNDDAPGKVWIEVDDAIRYEGHSGPTAFVFNVTRDGDTSAAASVAWTVSASGTHAANAADFFGGEFPSGTVSFAPGETARTITVNVNGDTSFEPDETFTVTLSNAVGVALGTGSVSTSLNDSASGGSEIKETYYTLAGGGGSFTLNYEMYSIPDQAEIFVNGALAATTGGLVSDTGTLTIAATDLHAGDLVLVRLTGNADSSTAWNYTIDYSGGVQSIGYLTNGTILNDDVLPVVDPGSPGNDTQTGTSSDDSLGGQDGDDEFVPGIGNDTVDGGPGIDKVRLPLFPNQFHFTATGTHQFSVGYMTFTTLITGSPRFQCNK